MRAPDHDVPADAIGLDRREFLRLSTAVAAAGALASAGCQIPQEATVPYHDMPEDLVDGLGPARFFRTVIDGSMVQVKTREGRPVLVTPAPAGITGRGLSVRHHAALMDLYDPDRARTPLSIRRGQGAIVASNWTAIGSDVVARLKTAGSKAVLLTGTVSSPTTQAAIAALGARTGLRHIEWSPLRSTVASDASMLALGTPLPPRPHLEKADLIVGLGAEFLDRGDEGFETAFAARRTPDPVNGAAMSRFIQLEGRLTLTGANADRRIRVRDSQLAHVGAAIAHELIVERKLGPLAGDPAAARALAGRGIDGNASLAGLDPLAIRSVATELANAVGRSLVIAGGSASASVYGAALETSMLLINATVGAFDSRLVDLVGVPVFAPPAGALPALLAEMQSGAIDLLIVAGANPAYDAPASFKVAEAFARVPYIVSLNDRVDETSRLADLLAPVSHPFECWSDAELPGSVFCIQQPVIQPLHDTRGLLDVLVDWSAALGDDAARAAVAAATSQPVPVPATGQRQASTSLAWHYLRPQWARRIGAQAGTRQFDEAWNEILRAGMWQCTCAAAAVPQFNSQALSAIANLAPPLSTLELQLYPHGALHDGRSGNNGWLHELPDPITRITWGGAVSIAPRLFDEMRLAAGDLVEIDAGHTKVVAPAYRHAGMHNDQIALPLGLGRTGCGAIGNDVGVNAFPLRLVANDQLISSAIPVSIRKAGGREPLADAQGADVIDRARRPLVPVALLSTYQEDPKAGTEQVEGGASAWPEHSYPNARWAMAIDLSKCTGCAKCVIGCQAENNIPIVGRHGILDGRPMSWLRIDRYYDAPQKDGGWDAEVWDGPLDVVEEPQTLFEPMLCQHCENAPCETVCPFSATMHSEDGLNQQIYNRCVGTRYCGNNCPFKVRRFNYWELSKKQDSAFFRWLVPRIAANADLNTREPMQLKNNPEVTVRSRGVMEKCSFCVQRIRAARAAATRDGRSKDHFEDGAVVPACMEACATGAITFGDRNAPGSKVAELSEHPRAMRLLDSLGVKPAISYLTKVRNDKA